MADFLSTGVTALIAFRRALDVTAHNIANVGTTGYSRQRAELVTHVGESTTKGYIGGGVKVSTVRRIYDDLLAMQVRSTASGLGNLQIFASYAERISNMFAGSETGLTASLQSFISAVQGVADAPSSIPARQVMLSEAQALSDRLRYFDDRLREIEREINSRIEVEAQEITAMAEAIARLNREIATAQGSGRHPPNDLLDERDRLLDDLASRISVSVVDTGDGSVNVFIGNGQPLVLGTEASKLVAEPDPFDAARSRLAIQTGTSTMTITHNLSGGRLGGLLDFRREMLDPARNALGRIAVALADAVNQQHRAGMDLTGTMGGDLFTVGSVAVLDHQANTGSASLAVARADTGALTGHDYILKHTGTGWELRRADTGAVVPLTGTGTAADPLRADGLEIVVSGTADPGDQFLIRPTRDAVAGFELLVSDPKQIAAAAPIRTAVGPNNTGSGTISAGEVTDPTHPLLTSTVTIEFLTPTTYSINGGPPVTYTPGEPIEHNGWKVVIEGEPAAGDTFTVSSNSGGTGDNRNALLLADVFGRPLLDGGTTSLNAAAGQLVGGIGSATNLAQINRDAQQVVHDENVAARDSVSGVNLDEEAANLLRFQHAYQVAAQLIQVANSLFDSVLAAVSRR